MNAKQSRLAAVRHLSPTPSLEPRKVWNPARALWSLESVSRTAQLFAVKSPSCAACHDDAHARGAALDGAAALDLPILQLRPHVEHRGSDDGLRGLLYAQGAAAAPAERLVQ